MPVPLLAAALLLVQDSAFLSPIEQGVMRCTEVADGAARLACYDRTARPLRELGMASPASAPGETAQAPAAAPAPTPAPAARPPAATAGPDSPRYADDPYASETARTPRRGARSPDGLPSGVPITEITYGPYGAARLVLANGQVWDQLDSDSTELRPSRRDAEAGLTATVERGALGSRRMTVEPTGRTIRVRPAE